MRASENQGAEDRVAPDSTPEQLTEYLAKTEMWPRKSTTSASTSAPGSGAVIATIAGMRQ